MHVQQETIVLWALEIPYQQTLQPDVQQVPLPLPAHHRARPVTMAIHQYPAVNAYPVLLIAIQSIHAGKVPLEQVLQQTLPL
jgi:hypothetical protein